MGERAPEATEAPELAAALPRFASLPSDPLPETATVHDPNGAMGPAASDLPTPSPSDHPEPIGPRSSAGPARTLTSSRTEVAAGMATALAGLLTLLSGLAWWLSRRPDGRQLRSPTPDDIAGVAKPLGRIGARHVPVEIAPAAVKSIMDGSEAAGAALAYLQRGPLLEHETKPTPPEEA
jgi:hypothetical protein